VGVNLYRRRKPNCIGGHPWQSRSSELEERRKSWRRCDCVIHFSATTGGKFGRKARPTTDWEEARGWASSLAASGTSDGPVAPVLPGPEAAPSPQRISIDHAIKFSFRADILQPWALHQNSILPPTLNSRAARIWFGRLNAGPNVAFAERTAAELNRL